VNIWLQSVIVFTTVAIADLAWTRYNQSVTARAAHRASTWSAVIVILGAVTFFGYVENRWMVIPAALGAYAGTYIAMRKSHG
jgi:hypothetical protein